MKDKLYEENCYLRKREMELYKEIERLEKALEKAIETNERQTNKTEELMTLYTTEREVKEDYKSIIKEVREYIKENQEEHKYTDRGGFTYTEGHFLRDSDTLLEILDKENK